jgi:hypothetical protein
VTKIARSVPKVKKAERSESKSSSSLNENFREALIRQISDSISNYDLEKANESVGVHTPKRADALSSGSNSSSLSASPMKQQTL